MKGKINLFLLVGLLFLTKSALSQTNETYYHNGQLKSIYFSNRIMYLHFNDNLTFQEKQSIISSASVDLLNGSSTNIPNYVKLRSRAGSGWYWHYPCATGSLTPNYADSNRNKPLLWYKETFAPPCPTCQNCAPIYTYYEYNNFTNAINSLSGNINIKSISKGFSHSQYETENANLGTDENFYIKIKPSYSISDFTSLINNVNVTYEDYSNIYGPQVFKIKVSKIQSAYLCLYANIFYNTGMCDFSTPNFLQQGEISATNDPRWTEQWGFLNTGQYGGIAGADIKVGNVWNFTKGTNVRVAVLDDGFYLTNPDLQPNFLPGFNATTNSDFEGAHGTDVAGVLGAVADNGIDISGAAPEAKLIPIKLFSASDQADNISLAEQFARGISWAYPSDGGNAAILNCSWNADYQSDLIDFQISRAATEGRGGKGCIIVFSSGNNNNLKTKYPSSSNPNIISVGAITHCNTRKSPTSCDPSTGVAQPNTLNWGSNFNSNLSLMAPGVRVPTVNYNGIINNFMNGTSASAPIVSGVVALMLQVNPNLTRQEVERRLELGSNRVGNYCYNWTPAQPNGPWNQEMGHGRINANNSVYLSKPGVTISNPVYNVPSQSSTIISSNIGVIFTNASCASYLPFGVAFVRRHEVRTTINYPYTPNPVIICSSNGFNLSNPNDSRRFAEAINVTNTSAILRSYIYYGYNSAGQELGWIPVAPSSITFTYVIVGSPDLIPYDQSQARSSQNTNKMNTSWLKYEDDEKVAQNDIPFAIDECFISPNPTSNFVNISIYKNKESLESFAIFNLLGSNVKLIERVKLSNGLNNVRIDISKLQKGVYFIKNNNKSYKFIKI